MIGGNMLTVAALGSAILAIGACGPVFGDDSGAPGSQVDEITIRYTGVRHAFLRGEDADLSFDVLTPPATAVEGAVLFADIGGLLTQQARIVDIGPGSRTPCRLTVPTQLLKAGSYTVECELRSDSGLLASARVPISIAPRWNPDRMRVWLWPHDHFGQNVEKLDDMTRKQLAWYADIGVNSFVPHGEINWEKLQVFDHALANGWEMGVQLSGSINDEFEGLPAEARYTGHREHEMNDPYHPEVARRQNEKNDEAMRVVRQFPGVKTSFFNSEIVDHMLGIETPMAKQLHAAKMGPTAPHEFIEPGVIPDNDEGLVKRLHSMRWGDGLTEANARAGRVAHRHDPTHVVFTDPLRRYSAYGRFRDMDLVSTWTYTNPDPKFMLYIETLIAAAKPTGQGVMHTVTLLNYPGAIFPKDKGWTLMGPDRLVETSWINLSRRPDGLSVYLSSACDPFDTEEGVRGDFDQDPRIPYDMNPPTFEAFGEFTREVVQPYGPMISKLARAPRRAAVLSSESSRAYSDSPNLVGYYGPYQIYSLYTLLAMIHVPADVIFDETIALDGLDDYDLLVLPKCDTLTKTVHDRILAFQERGGLVVSDQYLRASIPGSLNFDFDFTYRDRVTASAIADSKDYAQWDDRIDVEKAEMRELEGVSAGVDQRSMEEYAAQLRDGLEGKVARDVDCSSPTALLNMLQHGQAKYLFVVNDLRKYGDRAGKHRAMLDEAVPQTVTITLKNCTSDELFVYDMLERKRLDTTRREGTCEFDVDLPAPGGKIIALLPQKPAEIEILAPKRITSRGVPCRIDVLVKDADRRLVTGAQPLKVEITDPDGDVSEFSDYYAAESGVLGVDFVPALNDHAGKWTVDVTDLTAGLRASTTFRLAD